MRQAIIVAIRTKFKEAIKWKDMATLLNLETHTAAIDAYTTGMGYLKKVDPVFMAYYKPIRKLLL